MWAFCVSGVRAASQDGIDSNVKCTAALVVKDIRAIGAEIEGDVHLLSKGRSMYAAGTCHAGALYLPGTPKLRIPGRGWRCWWGPESVGDIIVGTGSLSPKNYSVKILPWSRVNTLVTRKDPESFPAALALHAHQGHRNLKLRKASDSVGDFTTVKNLKLTSKSGLVNVPPGQYDTFQAEGKKNGFVLGAAGTGGAFALYKLSKFVISKGPRIGSKISRFLFDDSVFHGTAKPGSANGIINFGINRDFLTENNRFGVAFYIAEDSGTPLLELQKHNNSLVDLISFKFRRSSAKILDLTKPSIARKYGYRRGIDDYSMTTPVAERARSEGFDVIRYDSEAGGGVNLAILDNFAALLHDARLTK